MEITAKTKARMWPILLTLAVNVPVSVFTAYCTTRFNAAAETVRAQEAQAVQVAQEQKYIEDLKEVRAEANQNAGNIERWLPGLVTIAKGCGSSSSTAQGASASGTARAT